MSASRPVALVTGASMGIGADLAELLAADGHDLVLVARGGAALQVVADRLSKNYGVDAGVIAADLAADGAPARIAAQLAASGIEIDVLVNNAGYGVTGDFVSTPPDAELRMLSLNVMALTELTKLFLPAMVARGRGGVLNVASIAAFLPGPLMAAYYASKAYVVSFSEALAVEVSDRGVRVCCVCPGATHTGFADRAGMGKARLFNSPAVMDSMSVARIGYRGFLRGERVVVTGLRNRALIASMRLAPRSVLARIAKQLNGA